MIKYWPFVPNKQIRINPRKEENFIVEKLFLFDVMAGQKKYIDMCMISCNNHDVVVEAYGIKFLFIYLFFACKLVINSLNFILCY